MICLNGKCGLESSSFPVSNRMIVVFFCVHIDAQVGKVTRGEWRLIVTGAVTKLETVCANINSGEINITELNIIKAKQRQMNQLCRVIDKSQMFDLPRSMEKRIKEFGHFKAYTMKLKYFIYHIRKVLVGKNDNC